MHQHRLMGFFLEERVDPNHGMLIVVDMQNDFSHRDGAACKRGRDMAFVENMIPRLVNLVNQARAHNFPICFVRTSGNQWTYSPVWTDFKNPDLLACADGSWGAEFHEGLEPRPGDMIVTKHRYSAFIGTDLDMLLRARGVKSLLVTGVGTGMCVFHTLTIGFMLDYYITLVEDCCATTYGPEAHNLCPSMTTIVTRKTNIDSVGIAPATPGKAKMRLPRYGLRAAYSCSCEGRPPPRGQRQLSGSTVGVADTFSMTFALRRAQGEQPV